jgi:hypothetical protein
MGEARGGRSVVRDPWPVFREESALDAPGRRCSRRVCWCTAEFVCRTLPPVFFRKDVILKGLCVRKVQEYHSKEVIGV